MTIQELITVLETKDQTQLLITFTMVSDAEIYFDWHKAGQPLGEFVEELKSQAPDATAVVDIEDGFIFREVKGVSDRYWSPDRTVIDFDTK